MWIYGKIIFTYHIFAITRNLIDLSFLFSRNSRISELIIKKKKKKNENKSRKIQAVRNQYSVNRYVTYNQNLLKRYL